MKWSKKLFTCCFSAKYDQMLKMAPGPPRGKFQQKIRTIFHLLLSILLSFKLVSGHLATSPPSLKGTCQKSYNLSSSPPPGSNDLWIGAFHRSIRPHPTFIALTTTCWWSQSTNSLGFWCIFLLYHCLSKASEVVLSASFQLITLLGGIQEINSWTCEFLQQNVAYIIYMYQSFTKA